jgi:hypothetical protein
VLVDGFREQTRFARRLVCFCPRGFEVDMG